MTDLPIEAQQALDQFDSRQSETDVAQRLVDALKDQEAGRG